MMMLTKACELRAQYFPNSHFCALESLQRLLDLLDVSKPSNARADHWMFVMRYVKESRYDRATRRHVQETCRDCGGLWTSSGAGVLVHGLFDRHEQSPVHGCFKHHFHIVRRVIWSLLRGTLSPMAPLINEFQLPIAHILENMHVITDSQVCLRGPTDL